MPKGTTPKKDLESGIDTGILGLCVAMHTPNSLHNSQQDKYRFEFDTGIEMFVPPGIAVSMILHLQEK